MPDDRPATPTMFKAWARRVVAEIAPEDGDD